MNDNLFICNCGSVEHQFIVRLDDEWDFVYVSIHLSPHPLHKRLINAIKYIFGHRSKYGDFDEIILNEDDTKKLVNLLSTKIN
jgi:hypothetical protein